jgi:hypothetical protein
MNDINTMMNDITVVETQNEFQKYLEDEKYLIIDDTRKGSFTKCEECRDLKPNSY